MPIFRNGGSHGEQVRNLNATSVISVGTTAVAIPPVADQKYIRIRPLSNGTYYYGFSSSVSSSNGEKFHTDSSMTILTSTAVYVIGSISGTTLTVTSSAGLVTEASDLINITSHGFSNSTRIKYTTTGTVIGGLTSGSTYFVVSSTANTFKLSLTPNGVAIDLTNDGIGSQTFNPNHDLLIEQGI